MPVRIPRSLGLSCTSSSSPCLQPTPCDSIYSRGTPSAYLTTSRSACRLLATAKSADISVASGRRFPSDTGAFADWVASSAAAAAAGRGDDLSLGFNASATAAAASGASLGAGLWCPASSYAASRQAAALNMNMNYGMADVGMVVVAPAASFHHTHHHHHHHEAAAAAAAADPIFPLLSAGPCGLDPDRSASAAAASTAIQFWQSQPPPQSPSSAAGGNPNPNASAFSYLKKPLPMLDTGGGSSGSGATTCQDCGNQAKKDCVHQRCRTCCKSRGLDCSTHVKSTWVPAARRRERQQLVSGSASSSPATASTAAAAAAAASASKKARLLTSQTTTSHTSTSNATTPRSFDTTSSHQDASFRENLPRQVRAPAVFRCVRVTSIDDGEDEYAYQATVTINGHVFKGFLYDQGVDDGRASNDDSIAAGVPNISELHLGGSSVSAPGGNAMREGGSSMLPSDMYGGGSGGGGPHILGGSGYGNTMN
ncbi:hypothetical protein GUJ93_ZPchr0007g6045 [Zizania palustris]|uniref:Uncharacterized protein n=1 Tax=Zizania palustris TaxID=103762 RepID=A0A8J5TBF9_ZIZPA|nr:hypothetical protein GUJ93_ZPchr0007g6045 [Zizania palustris]